MNSYFLNFFKSKKDDIKIIDDLIKLNELEIRGEYEYEL